MSDVARCRWCEAHPLLQEYHDTEWGLPAADDRRQFEHHVLEIFQAGLNWLTMLKKREALREAFAGFNPTRIARFGDKEIQRLLNDARIIRNRSKIAAVINNAPLFIKVSEEFGGFHRFLEGFQPPRPRVHRRESQIPAQTKEAEALSKELKRRGFKFVGPTICYAHMQAVGIVNDHITTCHRFGIVNNRIKSR